MVQPVVGYGNVSYSPSGFNKPVFESEFLVETVHKNPFGKYTGPENGKMPIQLKFQLKKGGQNITFPMMGRLKKRGVTGNMALEGREEALDRHKFNIAVEYFRNAVKLSERDEKFSFAQALPYVRQSLMVWSKEQMRDEIIDASFSTGFNVTMATPLINPDPTMVLPGDPVPTPIKTQATTAQLNTWLTNNADRVTFGSAAASLTPGNFAASLGNVSGPSDAFGAKMISRMKMMAEQADPHITPMEVGPNGEHYYVIFADWASFAQAQRDPDIRAFMKDSMAREGGGYEKNPIRTGGDLEWDGCVIKKVIQMSPHDFASGKGRQVLMGINAIGVAIGADPSFSEASIKDYDFISGIGIKECRGSAKMQRDYGAGRMVDYATITGFSNLNA
jgi:Protein of unknown function (DUF4043)